MRKPAKIALWIPLVALCAATIGGAFFLYAKRLPSPQSADIRGLLRWLVTRDLSQESDDTQEQLLARLERELAHGLELGDARDRLTDQQREQLKSNADLLGQRWFLKQVDRYSAIADHDKSAFVDQQIEEVQKSGIAKALSAIAGDRTSGQPKNSWAGLLERITRWIAKLEPTNQAKAQEFVAAVEGNLLMRTLRASWFSPAQAPDG
jgi:hypothetical protein